MSSHLIERRGVTREGWLAREMTRDWCWCCCNCWCWWWLLVVYGEVGRGNRVLSLHHHLHHQHHWRWALQRDRSGWAVWHRPATRQVTPSQNSSSAPTLYHAVHYPVAQIYRYIDIMITSHFIVGDHNVDVSIHLGHTVYTTTYQYLHLYWTKLGLTPTSTFIFIFNSTNKHVFKHNVTKWHLTVHWRLNSTITYSNIYITTEQ